MERKARQQASSHGSLANWHLHLLVTDGGFRADGTFVPLPLHDVTTLTEAFRRAVLRLFVRREPMDVQEADGQGRANGASPWRRSPNRLRDPP